MKPGRPGFSIVATRRPLLWSRYPALKGRAKVTPTLRVDSFVALSTFEARGATHEENQNCNCDVRDYRRRFRDYSAGPTAEFTARTGHRSICRSDCRGEGDLD